ncbi:patatin-like phospholipase family protein [Bradyrhizobium sp. IC3069]|uniref:patatin-like phospholipase family protein n=1 Tax=unclassified Bradyrhizobium TaxID=2631580 RepID=UPI001CD39067|nr:MULTISPECIES: patatin-like phospholipase family protein [unclassified Bradyrhizobium]MCA1359611.1 patatin-like phospholipase family protein [Bradyrhizobium sp. IC4059]MCA1519261.1 patatin-like phospholipase family protein [Bradyrhizobium sp. IC3069]
MITDPVHPIPTDDENKPLKPTTALCLSGGGYRAMVFHVGVLWRLYETGLLKNVRRISSVSGGSITAGMLALAWPGLSFTPDSVDSDFIPKFVAPLRAFAGITIDAESVILGALLPGSIGDRIAEAYDDHLFRGKTLQDMPDEPRFVINATNVQSGALWRFMKPYMRDYRVGEVKNPEILLAQAVAASSAFPPVLSPFELRLKDSDFVPGTGLDLQRPPFTTRVVLSDGGVYDNLGLETAWKRHQTVLVSDAGGKIEAEEEPETDWPRHSYRILNLIDNQVRSLRKRQVIASFKSGTRKGAYWGIRTDIADYQLPDALDCPPERTCRLAELPTRLKRLDDLTQDRLINWGYAVCDAALRKHVDPAVQPKPAFPYPRSGI